MINRLASTGLFAVFACMLGLGCSRAPVSVNKDANVKIEEGSKRGAFAQAMESFDHPRIGEDWTRFRDSFPQFGPHFADADVLERMRLEPGERKFLQAEAHLTDAELAEVESATLRAADAHHLDECYLLRDAARQLEHSSATPEEQAHLCFRWVMRNVMLHEQVDSWLPPAFTLRRGHGSALERALVFLALLRQTGKHGERIESCLIVVPKSEPLQFLVAVHDEKAKRLLLFDTRLEMPVLGTDGKSSASLDEVLQNPALLQPARITAAQVKDLEAWLVCPLYALCVRAAELQDRLDRSVQLHLSAQKLHQQISSVAKVPVKVWNEAVDKASALKDAAKIPNSPTRALRMFLPKQDGGVDHSSRLAAYHCARVPEQNMLANYAQVNLTEGLLPRAAFEWLRGISSQLLVLYDIQLRDPFLRGHFAVVGRRHERLRDFATSDALAGLAEYKGFRKELAEWYQVIKEAQQVLASDHADARQRETAQQILSALGSQDMFLAYLISVEKEDRLERDHKMTVLTRILAVGVRDHLSSELARCQASVNQEKAERAELQLRTNMKPGQHLIDRAASAWLDAKTSWGNFYLDRIFLEGLVQQQLRHLNEEKYMHDYDRRVCLLETLHLDVHRYFHAKLRYAECLPHTDKDSATKVREVLERTRTELESLKIKGQLQAGIQALVKSLPGHARPFYQKRLDLLAVNWSDLGSMFWLKQQLDIRINALSKH